MKRVAVGYGAYVAVFVALAAYRWHVWSYGADTGTFAQVAANAFSNFYDTSERGSHLHVHWSPILVVLAPLGGRPESGLAIQIAQVLAIGAGVFPFYAFLRRYADDGVAATLASLVLLYPPLLAVAFDEFHEIAFYPALVFTLVWAIDAGRFGVAAIAALLLALVREEVLIVLATFGLALAIRTAVPRERPRGLLFLEPLRRRPALALGLALAIGAPLVFAAYFGIVAPAEGGWTASHFYVYGFARGPRDVALAIVTQPLAVARAIATPQRAGYLLEAFGPLLFLGLRSPWMLVALPGLAIVLLSSDPVAWRMGSHYAAVWVPWLLLAVSWQIVVMRRARPASLLPRRLLAGVVAACALVLVVFDPLHPAHYLAPPYPDLASARAAFAATPASASVFTHDEWFARLTGDRPGLAHVWNGQEYAVLADDFPHPDRFLPAMRERVSRGCYRIERRVAAVAIYRRTAAAASPRCRLVR